MIMEKIIMTKKEFADFMEVKVLVDSVDAMLQTAQLMEENGDLTVDNFVGLLTGIFGESIVRYNELVTKHGLNEKSMDDIEVK